MQLENPFIETQANGGQNRAGSQARRRRTKRSTKGSGRQGAIILTMSNPAYHY